MSEWKEYKFTEAATLTNGRAYLQPELQDAGKYKIVRVGNLSGGDKWFYSDMELPEEKYCHKGDLLYAWACSFGPYIWNEDKTIYHYHIWKVDVNKAITDKYYLYYYLKYYTPKWMGLTNGSVMMHITKGSLEKQIISLPDLGTQRHIASILSSLDDKIAVNKKICENLEAQAQALFKHWFVDFAPFKDGKFVESELGLIPEGWRVGRLEEMASVVGSGGTPKSSVKEYYIGDILWYGTGEFNDSFIYDSEKHISQEAIDNSSAKIFPIHTVLIAMYGATVGKLAILSNEASFNQAALGIVAADSIGYPFIYLTLLACRKQLIRLACGAAQQNLNAGTIKSHLTIIPNDNTMMLFNDLILPIFEKVEGLQKESLRLATLRDALLPKLMSGEIKVNEIAL